MAMWQQELANAITDPLELCQLLQLPIESSQELLVACRQFSLRVPRGFVARMQVANPNDPLLLQILPKAREIVVTPGYSNDPLQEKTASPAPGLLHKYHGRVLLTLVGACAVNCRYCFRRHFPYQDNIPGMKGWQQALDYIASDSSIHEVILSGGDPLVVKDEPLAELLSKIEKISHVTTLRIHTRLPIVIPSRITDIFLKLMRQPRLKKVLVTHCNHANEIDSTVAEALKKCREAGMTLLNQAVLLHGINDDVDILKNLSHRLFSVDVLPYYLHVLDPVQGAAHFDIPDNKAKQLYKDLMTKLPGYLLPKLVREVPGDAAKRPV